MILQKSWQESLKADLSRLKKPDQPIRLAVLGVGHELYGDDAVGVWLAGRLKECFPGQAGLLSIQGGPAPENFTGTIRKFSPDIVLLVDAALMSLEPGQTGWLDWRDTTGFSASTHTLPLHLLASYLTSELSCEVRLLGIQPDSCQVGDPLSPVVQTAAEEIVAALGNLMNLHTAN
jgi:hydrogenase 3 maturation protease